MTAAHRIRPRLRLRQPLLVALLVVFCLTSTGSAAASAPNAEAGLAAPSGLVVGSVVHDVMGNRSRMIQVGAVFAVVGIFLFVHEIQISALRLA